MRNYKYIPSLQWVKDHSTLPGTSLSASRFGVRWVGQGAGWGETTEGVDDVCFLGSKSPATSALKYVHSSFSEAAIWVAFLEETSQVSLEPHESGSTQKQSSERGCFSENKWTPGSQTPHFERLERAIQLGVNEVFGKITIHCQDAKSSHNNYLPGMSSEFSS